MSALSGLLIIGLFVALWVNGTRAHEIAVRACVKGCKERGVQLLDQTVGITSIRPKRTSGGLRLRRIYSFDFSDQGVERYNGHITLVGYHVTEFSLGLPSEPPDAGDAEAKSSTLVSQQQDLE